MAEREEEVALALGPGRARSHLALPTVLAVALAGAALAQGVTTELVADGFGRPVFATAPPGDDERLFVVEQFDPTRTGHVRILDLASNEVVSTFLSVPNLATGNEQGLLGLAFHPDYAENGLFFVDYTAANGGTTHIVRYAVSDDDPNAADPGSAFPILRYAQPQGNHNGGWLGFGPDGYLYVTSGDGGFANDSGPGHTSQIGNAQDLTSNLLGKILRIDVDGGDDFPADALRNYAIPPDNPFVGVAGDDEIWAYGLRNPWRASFDRETGDLYVGDVGQGLREEIDVQPAGSSGGENYGWRLREGRFATPGVGGERPAGAIDPIHDYGRDLGRAITGGVVYRGPIESLRGLYFFADYVSARVWSLHFDGSDPSGFDGTNFTELVEWTALPGFEPPGTDFAQLSAFGEDGLGNVYIVSLTGSIYRLVPDSDEDGIGDPTDTCPVTPNGPVGGTCTRGPAAGEPCAAPGDCGEGGLCSLAQDDADGDGRGDACECGDANGDGFVTTTDARLVQRCAVGQRACAPLCDATADGACDSSDARLVQRYAVGQVPKSALRCDAD